MYMLANLAKSAVQRYTQTDKYILQPKYSNVPKECNVELSPEIVTFNVTYNPVTSTD